MARRQLISACLLAASSHGWAADLDPECYELYDQFLAADWVNAGRIAGRMHDMQCWPALQGSSSSAAVLPAATDCDSLVPHIAKMVNDKADINGYSILQMANAQEMTKDTRGKVSISLMVQGIDPARHNPFAARPLTGITRTLNCSAEASFTQGSYLIQMYLDRNQSGQEFIGMQVLMELR